MRGGGPTRWCASDRLLQWLPHDRRGQVRPRAPTITPADAAFERFRTLYAESRLASRDLPKLTEADTRAKLIDPLFKEVLGWREPEFRRETPVDSGYVDYTLGAESVYLLIEAKRTKPRFHLNAPEGTRTAKLSGPHLLSNKKLREPLEQAARYAFDLGAPIAVLTNGEQLIVFESRSGWTNGIAMLWHSHEDIRDNFGEFYSLMSAEAVRSGLLLEALQATPGVTKPSFAPLEFASEPERELVRNRFWQKMAAVFGPILTDQTEVPAIREEIIRNCYVTTPISDESDANLDTLLKARIPKFLTDAGVNDLRPGMHGKTAFDNLLENDVKLRHPGCYVLTGGVGSGKTTFLRRFALVVQPRLVREFCVWLHIDYLGFGNISVVAVDEELRAFTFKAIRRALADAYRDLIPASGEGIRSLFAAEIQEARLTSLFGLDESSDSWQEKVNSLVARLYESDQAYVEAVLRRLSDGRRVVLVLDNSDQLGEPFQASLFLFAQKLSRDHKALCVVALREEKFFAAYRRGIFDAFGDRRFHIGSPSLGKVIQSRLEYGLQKYIDQAKASSTAIDHEEIEGVRLLVLALIRSATKTNSPIVRMLACVSNGDMRHALDRVREFIGSGNTDIDKLLKLARRHASYTIPFHEFAKSAILGSKRFYQSGLSHVLNLFAKSSVPGASHLAALRLLARLCSADGAASPHGEGFVETAKILREYRGCFGSADDLLDRAEELLRRGLIESEPPRVESIGAADALRVAPSGAYYWRFLIRSFAYLDLVYVDTAIADRAVARSLGEAAESTDLVIRYDRVRRFLRYLESSELEELRSARPGFDLYRHSLVRLIRQDVDAEIEKIERKTKIFSA